MKSKDTIINEMVANSADVMEAKANELECIALQYQSKGENAHAAHLRSKLPEILQAIKTMRDYAGTWA